MSTKPAKRKIKRRTGKVLEFLKTGTGKSGRWKAPPLPDSFWRGALAAGAIALAALAVFFLIAAGRNASGDFMALTGALLTLCGLAAYDIFSRREWEKETARRLREMTSYHDRLVRETARNRTDIAIIKEGLAKLAMDAENEGRRLPASFAPEARLIQIVVERLGALGVRPRSETGGGSSGSGHGAEIMQLEMTPPPARPEPLGLLDDELGADPGKFSDTVMTDLIRHAVRNDQIDVFMQPVVTLPQRRPRMMEVFARIRAGAGLYLPAQRYMPVARQESLVPAIDNLLLLRCLGLLGDPKNTEKGMVYILNISAATLHDKGFMGDLVAFLSRNRATAARLVFEIPQREMASAADATLGRVLDGLARLGCRFSMDRVRDRTIDIALLKSRHIRFIKLDAAWLLSEAQSKAGFTRVVHLKKQLDAAGIDLIVEKIEDEATLRELLDFNVAFGQGYLFGKPDHMIAYKDAAAA